MKTILIISFSDLAIDPRVNRQIRFLSENYKVIAAGWADPAVENVQFIPIRRTTNMFRNILYSLQLLFRPYESWYWNQNHVKDCLKKLSDIDADLILANDIDTLPLAMRLSKGRKVIFDAHEYAPREMEDLLFWRIFFQKYKIYLCNMYMSRVNGMTTVCQGIADLYKKESGVEPIVVTNAPDFEEIQPNLLDENSPRIRLVYHGAAAPSRKIHNIIKIMDYLDGCYELNLLLVDSWPGYMNRLKRLAKGNQNIHFLPPVPMRTLPTYLNQFDVGVSIIEPTNFNFFHALPNKFFEYIQARLAIAIGPSPEMARIVKEYDLGVIGEDFSPKSLAQCLISLDKEKINYYKLQSHKIARRLSAEQNKELLLNLVQQVIEE